MILLAFLLVRCNQSDKLDQMVYFEGGTITVGSDDGEINEYPIHKAKVDPFYISTHLVTVADFQEFVEATNYRTDAEKIGNAAVFDVKTGNWKLVEDAYWKYPMGPNEEKAKAKHPVTQVSWNDAKAYSEWADVRLPTELEWEYAARSGNNSGDRFSWGDELVTETGFKANVWQGRFPDSVQVDDGYLYTSPVGEFGKTSTGLSDMGGNVWEWCANTYDLYEGNRYRVRHDPNKKVIRGGSFLCDSTACFSYRVSARSFNTRESATFHMGFRVAKSVDS